MERPSSRSPLPLKKRLPWMRDLDHASPVL